MKKIDRTVNAITGEVSDLERDETEAEIQERLEYETLTVKRNAEKFLKETARQKVLDKLGLSADEIAALLG